MSFLETVLVHIAYNRQSVATSVLLGKLLLLAFLSHSAISICSKSMQQASTNFILVFCIINNLQKLPHTKSKCSIQGEILLLNLLQPALKRQKHCKGTSMLVKQLLFMNATKTVPHHIARRATTQKMETFENYSHYYHIEVNSRENISAETFCQEIRREFLPPIDFHMARRTVIYHIMQSGFAKTRKTLQIFNSTCEEYHG